MKLNIQKCLPHILAVLLFIILGYFTFPSLFQGKIVRQNDNIMWRASAQELEEYRAETGGEEALWTNSIFSGMPATMISVLYKGNYLEPIYKMLFWGERPASYMILAMVSFYLLMMALGISPWLAIIGSIGFAYCAYDFQIIVAGHNSKFVAIALMPMVLAAIVYAYKKKALLGSVLFGVALSFEILANHIQITYYLAFIILFYVLSELYRAAQNKTLKRFAITSSFLLIFGVLGIATNTNHLWSSWEYTQYTMRGGSELQTSTDSNQSGLDSGYATEYSYGIGETLDLLIPNFNGGSSTGALSASSETAQVLRKNGVSNQAEILQSLPMYWGPQPFTVGPVYLGATILFLFVLGLFLIQGPTLWWILAVSILSLFMSWGSNFMWFTHLAFDILPLYNKFRTVSMALVIVQLVVPLFAVYTLHRLFTSDFEKEKVDKSLKWSVAITAGICLLFTLFPAMAGDFVSASDTQLPDWLTTALITDRISLLRTDAFRSLIFILLSAIIVWIGFTKRWPLRNIAIIIAVLVFVDLRFVGGRYLDGSDFVKRSDIDATFTMRPVDKYILQDKDLDYRVLDLTSDVFNTAIPSYYHKSIGGYSAAKLRRYQDLIEYYIAPEIQAFISDLPNCQTMSEVDESLQKLQVVNMLNTKYVIIDTKSQALTNSAAFGSAWLLSDLKWVSNPIEEIEALKAVDLRNTAVINQEFKSMFGTISGSKDSLSNDYIKMIAYAPNKLEYKVSVASNQCAVFSEIYYPKGWKAFVDGQEVPLARVDYVLRAIPITAGEHDIVMEYSPESYFIGAKYSAVSSSLLLFVLCGSLAWSFYQKKRCCKCS